MIPNKYHVSGKERDKKEGKRRRMEGKKEERKKKEGEGRTE